jgi:hypothetical protein
LDVRQHHVLGHVVLRLHLVVAGERTIYRQPGLLCTPWNFARSSKFLGEKYFLVLIRLFLRHFRAFPKI